LTIPTSEKKLQKAIISRPDMEVQKFKKNKFLASTRKLDPHLHFHPPIKNSKQFFGFFFWATIPSSNSIYEGK
jgi:hypothetical protein